MSNTTKKPTIIDNFNDILNVLEENGLLTDDRKAFLEKRIEVTAKKNASSGGEKKLTPTQIANKGIAKAIFDHLNSTNKALTISAMIKEIPACADLSNQKINGILIREYNSEKYPNANPLFVRTEEKGVAYFKANPDYIAEVVGE
jgi:hypothetical protein